MHRTLITLLAAATLLTGCAALAPATFVYAPAPVPQVAFASTKPGWSTSRFAIAAAHPHAADAGYQVLRAGGSAVDAAIAAQMVLSLVEPQSSGIGGGAFLLHHDGRRLEAFDGRETAPAAADENLFLDAQGRPLPIHEAVVGGRSVGVPGTLRMLEAAHREHGRLPWRSLFQPAIQLAEQGFAVTPRLASQAEADPHLRKDPAALAYFYGPDGKAHPAGTVLRNPEFAAVLRRVAAEGADAFYRGAIAQAIVEKVQKHPTNPGKLGLADLAGYQSRKRAAMCHDHRALARELRICGFPPPSSGLIATAQMLGILASTDAHSLPLEAGLPSPQWLHLYTEAARLAFADRAQYLGDPEFVQPPAGGWASLLEPSYLAARARLIGPQSMKTAQPGAPGRTTSRYAPAQEQVEYGTSHISIVDGRGNALAMTTTVEDQFGARQMVHGFILNNELTDFSFAPVDATGRPVANRVEPGKRPRSSMSPTLVFDKPTGQLLMAAGSMGGAMIIHHVTKVLYGVLHWNLDVQRAIELPNFGSTNGPTILEAGRFPAATVQALQARGHEVREQPITAGSQAIQRTGGGWFGGADPRRDGIVMGD